MQSALIPGWGGAKPTPCEWGIGCAGLAGYGAITGTSVCTTLVTGAPPVVICTGVPVSNYIHFLSSFFITNYKYLLQLLIANTYYNFLLQLFIANT